MAMIKCSECGSSISEKASICPKCGCPIDVTVDSLKRKKIKMKKLILLVIVGVLCLSALIVLGIKLLNRPDKSGYYQDTKWGMSIEQVKGKIEGNPTINEEKETILNSVDVYDDIQGIEAIELYDCTNDSLCKVTVYLTNTGESAYTDARLIDKYENLFTKLYGEKKEDGINTYWVTTKSKVSIIYLSDGLIVITYEDINNSAD